MSIRHYVEWHSRSQRLEVFNLASLWLSLVSQTWTHEVRGGENFALSLFLMAMFSPSLVPLGPFALKFYYGEI